MDIVPVTAKAKVDIKGDVTKVFDEVANTVATPRKGIAKLFNAWLGPRIAEREAMIDFIKAQSSSYVMQIKEGKLNYDIQTKSLNPVEFFAEHTKLEQTKCMFETASLAMNQLNITPEEEISDAPLNKDFWNKWQREAEIIEEDELKQWWAYLLTAEIKKPNSISKRTLDVVKNLTTEEASLFEQILVAKSLDSIILKKSSPVNCESITLGQKLLLINAGLLHANKDIKLSKPLQHLSNGKNRANLALQNYIIISNIIIETPIWALTSAGSELSKTIALPIAETQAVNIAEVIFRQNQSAKIELFEIAETDSRGMVTPGKKVWESK